MSVHLKKKRDVTESRYGQNYFVTFFFACVRTGVHTIRDSCYHKQEGAEKTWGDGCKHVNGKINYQLQKFTPLGLIS